MVELHNKDGELIRVDLASILEIKQSGARSLLKRISKSRRGTRVEEFEVLEPVDLILEMRESKQ